MRYELIDHFKNDRTMIIELLSAVSFFVMGLGLIMGAYPSPDGRYGHFWSVVFILFAMLQGLSLICKNELEALRIVLAWFAGTTWVILSYTTINKVLAVPIMFTGLFNIYAFVHLVARAKVDWSAFKQQQIKNGDSHT